MEESHFVQSPTNVMLQQSRNNIRTGIPQQAVADNVENLGFRQFCYDQERQRRIWVEQQISSHHERCRESQKRVVNDGSNSSAPSLPFFPVNSQFSLGEDNGGVLEQAGDADIEQGGGGGDALLMRGSEQYVTLPPHSLHNQQDSQIKRPPIRRPHFREDVEIKEQVRKHNQSKRFKCSKEVVIDENCRPAVDLDQSGYRTSASNKNNQMFDGSVQGLKALRGDEREDVPREFKNGKEGDHKMIYLNPETEYLFTSLVNRLMDRQERFHLRFLETIERLDEKRREREEAWRQQELARLDNEAITKSRDQAMALSREATIISYLDKIMGQSIITPPSRKTHKVAESTDMMKKLPSRKRHEVAESTDMKKLASRKTHEVAAVMKKKNVIKIRWPNSEVEDLIRIRVSYEPKFRDPTQKGSLWEEISELMASMGYRRNAQRCREKWENINRYYKKVKENSKVQSPHKQHYTCPYFQQLDQFYASKSTANGSSFCTKLQERNLLPFDNVLGIQEWRNWKDDIELNNQIVRDQYDDHEEEGREEEEEEDDDDEEEEESNAN